MVRYIDTAGDEHYVRLAEAASVPFENGRMARNIPAYRDSAHTPGRYWAATTGELVEFESHLEEKWLTLLDFDAGVTGFSSQPMELEAADENGPWHHVPDIFARRADGSALLLDVRTPPGWTTRRSGCRPRGRRRCASGWAGTTRWSASRPPSGGRTSSSCRVNADPSIWART
jgi:hypothetical protein